MSMNEDLNRIKVVLVEKKKTSKWLAEHPATISKWCTNKTQPSLEMLKEISRCLDIDIKDLLVSSN